MAVQPVVAASHALVQLKDDSSSSGHRPVRVHAWDAEGEALILVENRLVRATDDPRFIAVVSSKWGTEGEVDVPAAAGWRVRIVDLGPHWDSGKMDWPVKVGGVYPVIMWRYLGPTDVRPVIPRPAQGNDGEPVSQRGYDPLEMKMVVHLVAPDEA